LGEPDENAFRPADVAEPVRVLVLDHVIADELRAMLGQPAKVSSMSSTANITRR
jgi:hypothetical protein